MKALPSLRVLPLLLLPMLILPPPAAADTVRLTTRQWEPYQWLADGTPTGPSIGILNCAFAALGHSVTFNVTSWKRAQVLVERGTADGFFLASQSQERDEFAVLSEMVMEQRWTWFFREGDTIRPDKPGFKSTARLGGLLGSNMTRWLEDAGYNVIAHPTRDDRLVELLLRGRIDAFLQNHLSGEREVSRSAEQHRILSADFRRKPLGVYFSKIFLARHPGLLKSFNAHLPECRKSVQAAKSS